MEFLQELEVIMVSILKIRGVNRETMKTGGSVHPGGGGYSLIWAMWGRAAGQGMVFGLAVLNRV